MGIWLKTRNAGLFMFTLRGRRGISPDSLPFPVLNFHPSKDECVCVCPPLCPTVSALLRGHSLSLSASKSAQSVSAATTAADTLMLQSHLFLSPSHSPGLILIVTSFSVLFLLEGRVHLCIGLLIRTTPKHLRCLCREFDDGCPPEIRESVNDLIINYAYECQHVCLCEYVAMVQLFSKSFSFVFVFDEHYLL